MASGQRSHSRLDHRLQFRAGGPVTRLERNRLHDAMVEGGETVNLDIFRQIAALDALTQTRPDHSLSVVALTNTAFEGMCGAFPTDIRNAVYG